MSRRADPERISSLWIAIRNRLLSAGLSPETTEFWLTARELEAAVRQLPTTGDFWSVGDAWIEEQRAARRGLARRRTAPARPVGTSRGRWPAGGG